jgi:antitoxin component YwqK of YwqJK toxin-antitoxin module
MLFSAAPTPELRLVIFRGLLRLSVVRCATAARGSNENRPLIRRRAMRANQSKGGAENGVRTETFRDGKVSGVGRCAGGKKSGVWKYYFRNGLLKATGKYSNGQLEGAWKWCRENGGPLQTGSFKNGKQAGLWKRYRENGKLYDVYPGMD